MTPQRNVLGQVWHVLEMIADLVDLPPLLALAILVAVLWWLYSRVRNASGAEVVE